MSLTQSLNFGVNGDGSEYRRESSVASYSKQFPARFATVRGCYVYDNAGTAYLDFLSGCGSLNYGHNEPRLMDALQYYIRSNGVAIGLDMHTEAKSYFISEFRDRVLAPRKLDYRLQFTGPTGTNAVEAAIKLARKFTGRTNVLAFTNGFHGCTAGSLSLTGSRFHRSACADLLHGVTRVPYDGYFGPDVDTGEQIESLLGDPSSGIDPPAAFVLETVQGEGGLNVASARWLRRIADVALRHGALLIVDDIQAGCGRTGTFFSFEAVGIAPDIVVLAKSLSGVGLPMSLVLIKPELDVWQPGEHNGTFRGNCHAFVTGAAALECFWADGALADSVRASADRMREGLAALAGPLGLAVKGTGLMQGIDMEDGVTCDSLRKACFREGLILEACGPHDEVLKLMPPLNVGERDLARALDIIGTRLAILDASGPAGGRTARVFSFAP